MDKKKLLIVGPARTITIVRNAEMLKKRFSVKLIRFRDSLSRVIDIFKTFRGVLWADVTLSHFATMHAFWTVFFSKILHRKSIVIVAGHEVAKVPEIGYGVMLNPAKAWLVRGILKHSDAVFAVSEFTQRETLNCARSVKNIRRVYGCNAIDCDQFRPGGEKEDLVLTIGFLDNSNVKRKGFETFLKAAEYLPHFRFKILGRQIDNSTDRYLKSILPQNVTLEHDSNLLMWYQRAKVYCQLSYYESFGVCLIEAMSCECVPVVTDRGALPEVVGEVGFCVPYGDPDATAAAIERALKSDRGVAARERVKERFSVEAGREQFADEIEKLLI